jgi:hypothetical protein
MLGRFYQFTTTVGISFDIFLIKMILKRTTLSSNSVNKKASNIAVMSELGRFLMYFSVIISMKLFLNNTINPVPSYFYAGSRIGQILHTRIRTESSALKDHLYKKNKEITFIFTIWEARISKE